MLPDASVAGRVLDRAPNSRRNRIRFTSNVSGSIFLIADVLCVVASALFSFAVYALVLKTGLETSVHLFALAAMIFTFFLIRSSRNAYRKTIATLSTPTGEPIVDGLASVLIASALVWQFGLIEHYSRGAVLIFSVALSVFEIAAQRLVRTLILHFAKLGAIQQRVAFYGANSSSISAISVALSELNFPHLKIVGIADDRPKRTDLHGFEFLGGFPELLELAKAGELDQVIICVPDLPAARTHEIVDALSSVSVDVSAIPAIAIELAPDYRVHLLGHIPVLSLWQRPFRDINQVLKTIEDWALAALAVLISSPLMAISALLIKLTSPGPILFIQPRMGFNNEVIDVFKFRTMYIHATDVGGVATTVKGDARITPVGRVLRRLSLDELPQLFNVLRGEMSLVGPRPHALEMKVGDRFYKDAVRGYSGRHRVKPGSPATRK